VAAEVGRDDAVLVRDGRQRLDHALAGLPQVVERDERRAVAGTMDVQFDGGRE
jgi:hypothetical protein